MLLWALLLDDFLKTESVPPPSDREIQSFITFMDKSEVNGITNLLDMKIGLQEELKSFDVTEEKKAQISDRLINVTRLIRSYRDRQNRTKDAEFLKMEKESKLRVAYMAIRQWKFNQTLYHHYQGRVIFQQAGWEPIDAYQKFLETANVEGKIEIFDKHFKGVFEEQMKDFKKYYDQEHLEVEKGMANFYFEKPWWERSEEELTRMNQKSNAS